MGGFLGETILEINKRLESSRQNREEIYGKLELYAGEMKDVLSQDILRERVEREKNEEYTLKLLDKIINKFD